VFKIGVTLAYQLGFNTRFMNSATVTFGVTSSLPNGASVTADLKDKSKSTATGFEGAKLEPIYDLQGLSSTVQFAVFTQFKLVFGIDIDHIAKVDVDFEFKMPQLDLTISAAYGASFFVALVHTPAPPTRTLSSPKRGS